MSKRYKRSELPHLRIPVNIRHFIRQCGGTLGVQFDKVQYTEVGLNYLYTTDIITLEQIDFISKNSKRKSRIYLKENLFHNAKCYIMGELDKLKAIDVLENASLKEQSITLGKSKDFLHVHKNTNSAYYRYLRFLGRGDFIKAIDIMNNEQLKISKYAYAKMLEFNEHCFEPFINKECNINFACRSNTTNLLNRVLMGYDMGFKTYRNAKKIYKNLKKFDYIKLAKGEDGLYIYDKGVNNTTNK